MGSSVSLWRLIVMMCLRARGSLFALWKVLVNWGLCIWSILCDGGDLLEIDSRFTWAIEVRCDGAVVDGVCSLVDGLRLKIWSSFGCCGLAMVVASWWRYDFLTLQLGGSGDWAALWGAVPATYALFATGGMTFLREIPCIGLWSVVEQVCWRPLAVAIA